MGMFDYVDVDQKHGIPVIQYQSKDLDCEMTVIRITSDGRLEIERFEYESVPKSERLYPDDDGFLGMMGSQRKVNRRWEDLNYHGMFNFYGNDGPNFEGEWYDFDAKFTDGNLVEIVRSDG